MPAVSRSNELTHIAFILDGNRRWAKSRGLPAIEGHRRGYDNLKDMADVLFARGVKYVTAYVFSTENWQRSRAEVKFLMKLAYQACVRDIKILQEKNIRFRWLGSRAGVDDKLARAIEQAECDTAGNDGGTLSLCFNYGGRAEIIEAVQKMAAEKLAPAELTEAKMSEHLYTAGMPDPDLIVRTSGEMRLSNFLLWQCAYSELYFEPCHWPDFDEHKLDKVLDDYHNRVRRFGQC